MTVGGVPQLDAWYPSKPAPSRAHAEESCAEVAPHQATVKEYCSTKEVKDLFSIDPPVVNFGAFAPLEVRSKTLRIINTSSTPVRFCILHPDSDVFRISFEKKSCLAPGMAQKVTIYFVPAAWKLYKSSLKVIGVPVRALELHGTSKPSVPEPCVLHHVRLSSFPELRNMRLPRFLNFGSVPLGMTKRKTLKLSNPHQVSFQFAVHVVTNNAAFSVEPLSGDVSATSTQVLTISYSPQVRATAFFAIEVHIADFKSKPFHVEAIGTCWKTATRFGGRTTAADDTSEKDAASRATTYCCTHPQRRDLRTFLGRCNEVDGLRFQPKQFCPPGLLENNSCTNAGFNPSCVGEMEKRKVVAGQTECSQQRTPSSECVRDIQGGLEQVAGRTGGISAAFIPDDSIRVAKFNRRWQATVRSVCVKTYKSTILGEAPTTELKRQRLLSKRLYNALNLLRKHSELDTNPEYAAVCPETVVVPSRWVPRRVHSGTSHTEVSTNNLYIPRMESIEKFARIVSVLIKRIRASRRLNTLQKALELRQTPATSDTGAARTVSSSSDKLMADDVFPEKETKMKELKISLVQPQRTTYQELFQVTSAKSSIPSTFLARSKIEVSDVFKSLDNYDFMTPLPPLDYEIMRLPDVETPNPAWHLEPTDRRLLRALLGHRGSISMDRKPRLSARRGELKFPQIVVDRPLVNAAQLIAPPTTEFRPFIPLPKNVETDLGYCFNKVQPENAFKRGPRLLLPCVGDTAVSTTHKSFSSQKCEDCLLAEIQGNHALYGQQPLLGSSPYLGKAVGNVARGTLSVCKVMRMQSTFVLPRSTSTNAYRNLRHCSKHGNTASVRGRMDTPTTHLPDYSVATYFSHLEEHCTGKDTKCCLLTQTLEKQVAGEFQASLPLVNPRGANIVPVCQMSDTDSDSHQGTIEIPAPPLEKYVQSDSGDEKPSCGTAETVMHGVIQDSKYEEFAQATAALSESWGRRGTERLGRLNEINMTLPSELRMDLP